MVRAMKPTEPALPPADEQQPVAEAICEAIGRTAHLLGRFANARLARYELPGDLSAPRMRLLFAVKDAPRIRMGDLAARLCVTARTITTMVDALEKDEMIVRLPDPTDRRATLLELTPAGRAHLEQMRATLRALSDEIVAPLDAGQQRQLLGLLHRLTMSGPLAEAGGGGWCCDRRGEE